MTTPDSTTTSTPTPEPTPSAGPNCALATGSGLFGALTLVDSHAIVAALAANPKLARDAELVKPGITKILPKLIERGEWLASVAGMDRALAESQAYLASLPPLDAPNTEARQPGRTDHGTPNDSCE